MTRRVTSLELNLTRSSRYFFSFSTLMFLCCRLLNSRQPVETRTLLSITSTLLLPSTQCRSYGTSQPPLRFRRKFRQDKRPTGLILEKLKQDLEEPSATDEPPTPPPRKKRIFIRDSRKAGQRKEDGNESKPARVALYIN